MSETALTSFATSALQRCSPQFQVISLITIFLSVLVSTVYIVHLALYTPLERVVMLLALGYAGWQMQHASSVHQLPAVYSEPSILLNTSSEPDLPAYTPKSTDSSRSDDSDDSDDSDASDASDASLPTVPSVSLSNPAQGPSPTSPEPPQLSIDPVNVSFPSSTASASVSWQSVFPSGLSAIESSPISPVTQISSPPALAMSDTSTELDELPPLIDECEEYTFDDEPLPSESRPQPQRQIVYTTFDSDVLVMPGSTISTHVVKEFDNGSLDLEVSCGNIDYRLRLCPSEVLQLYEDSVKRPL